MIGPGKYDKLCTDIRAQTRATGGVIVIVFGGEYGDGFSMQATPELTLLLPKLLRNVADQIAGDAERLRQ